MSLVEGGGRSYGRRALLGVAPSLSGAPVRAFAPFRLSTYKGLEAKDESLAARYMQWQAGMVMEAIEARGGDIKRIDWSITTPEELIKIGGAI